MWENWGIFDLKYPMERFFKSYLYFFYRTFNYFVIYQVLGHKLSRKWAAEVTYKTLGLNSF